MSPFRQMNVALARLKPCPVRYLTQGRGRLGLLGYTDHTDAVLRKKQGGEGMLSLVETGRVWPFGGVTTWGLRVVVPSRSCLRYQHPPVAGSTPCSHSLQAGSVCLTAGSQGCKCPRGSCKGKEKRGLISPGELVVSPEQRGFSLLQVSAAAKEGKKSSLYADFINK